MGRAGNNKSNRAFISFLRASGASVNLSNAGSLIDFELWTERERQEKAEIYQEVNRKVRKILHKAVHSMVNDLPPSQRKCIIMYYWYQIPMADIATELKIDSSTVSRNISAGQKNIGKQLKHFYPPSFLEYYESRYGTTRHPTTKRAIKSNTKKGSKYEQFRTSGTSF